MYIFFGGLSIGGHKKKQDFYFKNADSCDNLDELWTCRKTVGPKSEKGVIIPRKGEKIGRDTIYMISLPESKVINKLPRGRYRWYPVGWLSGRQSLFSGYRMLRRRASHR